jgi:hypothetical protein
LFQKQIDKQQEMSEEDDIQEQEVIKEPPREDPGKRFFISHVNSYMGRTLCRELKNEHLVRETAHAGHTFSGTLLDTAKGGQRIDTIEGLPS